MKKLILVLLISHFLYSCISNAAKQNATMIAPNNYVDPYLMIADGQSLLKEGDLVVRLNRDPFSEFIKKFNRHDKSYSHAGIVLFEKGCPYVYHIINGEENPDEKLKKDSLSVFCNPRKNMAYGIFRYEMKGDELKRLKSFIHKWYIKGVRFDSSFNFRSDDRMYCSEMISKALRNSTRKRILIETTKLTITEARFFSAYSHLPFAYTSKLRIVAIDNLYINPYCHLIKKYDY